MRSDRSDQVVDVCRGSLAGAVLTNRSSRCQIRRILEPSTGYIVGYLPYHETKQRNLVADREHPHARLPAVSERVVIQLACFPY
jgi:hypothetical protein